MIGGFFLFGDTITVSFFVANFFTDPEFRLIKELVLYWRWLECSVILESSLKKMLKELFNCPHRVKASHKY